MPRVPFAALVLTACLAGGASAQPAPAGGGLARPTVSPYVGLLNRGFSPSLNYLSIVRPQQQLAQQFGQIQAQQQQTANALQQDNLALGADPTLPQTGVVGRFNSTGGYFSRHPVTGTGGAGGAYGGAGGLGGGTGNLFANNRVGAGVSNRAGGGAGRSGGAGRR